MCNSLASVKNEVKPLSTHYREIWYSFGKLGDLFAGNHNCIIQGHAEREMSPTKLMQWLRQRWTGIHRNATSGKQKACPYTTWICTEMVRWFQNRATLIQPVGKLPSYLRDRYYYPYSTYRVMSSQTCLSLLCVHQDFHQQMGMWI